MLLFTRGIDDDSRTSPSINSANGDSPDILHAVQLCKMVGNEENIPALLDSGIRKF